MNKGVRKIERIAQKSLKIIEVVAKQKANCLCMGRFYEPKVPAKLVK